MALRSLKDFQILKLIKQSIFYEIYLVKDRVSNLNYIMKKIYKRNLTHADLNLIFSRFDTIKKITNPAIVSVFERFEDTGKIYMIIEYIEGESLSNYIFYRKYSELFTSEIIVKFLLQMVKGIESLHNAGVIHGDIKPSNFILTPWNTVKAIDIIFGILGPGRLSKMSRFERLMFRLGIKKKIAVITGTLPYMAPELIFNQPASIQTDIYSLGITMYFLLTGELPLPPETLNDSNKIKLWHLNPSKIPKLPQELKKDIPVELENIILKCIAVDKRDRFQTAEEIKIRLENVFELIKSGQVF